MKFNKLALLLTIASITGIAHAATVEGLEKDRAALQNEIEKLVKKKEAAHATIRDSNAQIDAIAQTRREMREQISQLRSTTAVPATAAVSKKVSPVAKAPIAQKSTPKAKAPTTKAKAKTTQVTRDTTKTKPAAKKTTKVKTAKEKAADKKEAEEKAKKAKTAAVKKKVTRN